LAPALFPTGGLYTPELRRRTLAATAAASERTNAPRLLLFAGLSVTSLAVSLVLPVWLLSQLLGAVCPTSVCALAGASVIFLLAGVASALAVAVPALRNENFRKAAASRTFWR
jgi:hypothetical protein